MSTTAVAYTLTDAHELRTYGGTTHLRDGLALNIADALAEGARPADADETWPEAGERGLLVTDDPVLIQTLNERHDLNRLERIPEGAKITSHQLAPTASEQHDRDKSDVPAIALQTGAMTGAEVAAAQLAGTLPVPTEAPEQPDTPDAPAEGTPDGTSEPGQTPEPPSPPDDPAAAAAASPADTARTQTRPSGRGNN